MKNILTTPLFSTLNGYVASLPNLPHLTDSGIGLHDLHDANGRVKQPHRHDCCCHQLPLQNDRLLAPKKRRSLVRS